MKGPESVGGVVAAAASSRKKKAYLYIFNSLTAIVAIVAIFVVNTMGVVRMIQVLVGSQDLPHSYGYYSYSMPYLLREIAIEHSAVQNRVQSVNNSIKYEFSLKLSKVTSFKPNACSTIYNATTDRIYKAEYVSFLLNSMMAGYGSQSKVTDNSTLAVIDCTFEGRKTEDTTSFKAHLLDANLKWILTFQLQTVMANIPARRDTMPTGTVTITNMSFASLTAASTFDSTDLLVGLSSSDTAVHRIFASRGFPFNNSIDKFKI
ncbi:hypothetical protein THRCLA_07556 [Thraustotheca clavata]|uniref:Uncharacterized protein n=1 Tax=Thraustotheca clavata TaxID=74557 RepID=A0A1V9ZCZ0_9STRA|nr:hypothetical protein THRCLA_07556 [Thraustotheca clavata]